MRHKHFLAAICFALLSIALWSCCPVLPNDCYSLIERRCIITPGEADSIKGFFNYGEWKKNEEGIEEQYFEIFVIAFPKSKINGYAKPIKARAYWRQKGDFIPITDSLVSFDKWFKGESVEIKTMELPEGDFSIKLEVEDGSSKVFWEIVFDIREKKVRSRHSKWVSHMMSV